MTPDPTAFVCRWCAAWNRHDTDAVLAHFTDDVIFTSPIAQRVVPETGGIVRGKAALRDYWEKALTSVPDLHFTIIDVYEGIDTVVIHYRNHLDAKVCELLHFDGALVSDGHAAYIA